MEETDRELSSAKGLTEKRVSSTSSIGLLLLCSHKCSRCTLDSGLLLCIPLRFSHIAQREQRIASARPSGDCANLWDIRCTVTGRCQGSWNTDDGFARHNAINPLASKVDVRLSRHYQRPFLTRGSGQDVNPKQRWAANLQLRDHHHIEPRFLYRDHGPDPSRQALTPPYSSSMLQRYRVRRVATGAARR